MKNITFEVKLQHRFFSFRGKPLTKYLLDSFAHIVVVDGVGKVGKLENDKVQTVPLLESVQFVVVAEETVPIGFLDYLDLSLTTDSLELLLRVHHLDLLHLGDVEMGLKE